MEVDDITEFDPRATRVCERCGVRCSGDVPLEYFNERHAGDENLSKAGLQRAVRTRPGKSVCPKCVEYLRAKQEVIDEMKLRRLIPFKEVCVC